MIDWLANHWGLLVWGWAISVVLFLRWWSRRPKHDTW